MHSKRQILKLRLQQIHDKHTEFLQMERKKNEILQKLNSDKQKLEKILVGKIEKDLSLFEENLKKLDPIRNELEYGKISKKIKICTLKKEVIHSKIESILKTAELTELKSLDLNECHCVFCKGYSPHQYYFGIRQDINGQKYRREKEEQKQQNNEIEKFINDDEENEESCFDDEEEEDDQKLSVIEEHSSEEKHDELLEKKEKKMKRGKKILAEDEAVDHLMKNLKKRRQKMSERQRMSERCVKSKEFTKISRSMKRREFKKDRRGSTMSLNADGKNKLDKMQKMRHNSLSSAGSLRKEKHSKKRIVDLEQMVKQNQKSQRKSSRIIRRHKHVMNESEEEEKVVSVDRPKSTRRSVKIKRTKSSR